MGKNWRGGHGKGGNNGRDRAGARVGGDRGNGHGGNDLASCRGHGIIIGTCDAAREKETSKELVNLFAMLLEDESLFPKSRVTEEPINTSMSIKDMLAQELSDVRSADHKVQSVRSIQTNVKGITCIKIMRHDVDPVVLVKMVFDKVKSERLPCTRHVVRLIPLQRVFFPNEEEYRENIREVVYTAFPDRRLAAEDVADDLGSQSKQLLEYSLDIPLSLEQNLAANVANTDTNEEPERGSETAGAVSDAVTTATEEMLVPESEPIDEVEQGRRFAAAIAKKIQQSRTRPEPRHAHPSKRQKTDGCLSMIQFGMSYKARNHTVIGKEFVYKEVCDAIGDAATYNNRKYEAIFMMESLKNIGGVSFIRNYFNYEEFNLRKYQEKYAPIATENAAVDEAVSCMKSEVKVCSAEEDDDGEEYSENEVDCIITDDSC